MRFLSRIEEIILLAIWKLGDNAYGMAIRDQVDQDTRVHWVSGMIYGALSRLMKNGYVYTAKGEPTPERGGRHKIYYHLTPLGKEKLAAVQQINQSLWADVPEIITDES